jgi:hypothetical protein
LAAFVAAGAATMGVAAAQASAASIAVGQACVVNANPGVGSQMTVTGTGFTPGDTIDLQTTTGGAYGTTTADPTGNISAQLAGPILSTIGPGMASFTMTATDEDTALPTAPSTTFDVANLAVSTNPAEAKPTKRVTWSFSGFIGGAEIYAHYLHDKKVVARTKFGRASGPCGTLKTKKVFFPGKPKYDSYQVQVDDAARYSARSLPHLIATLKTHIRLLERGPELRGLRVRLRRTRYGARRSRAPRHLA